MESSEGAASLTGEPWEVVESLATPTSSPPFPEQVIAQLYVNIGPGLRLETIVPEHVFERPELRDRIRDELRREAADKIIEYLEREGRIRGRWVRPVTLPEYLDREGL